MRALAVCLLSVAMFLPACASRENYILNRVADLSDILRLHVMAGPGVAVKVEATRLLHAGGAYTHNVFAWGWHNRALGAWRESIRSWGLIVGHHQEEISSPIDVYSGSYGWTFGDGGMGFESATGGFDLDLLTFRAQIMFLIGVDAEVRVGEVLDFLAGILQFDPAGDDRDYENMRRADLPEESDEPVEPMLEDDEDSMESNPE